MKNRLWAALAAPLVLATSIVLAPSSQAAEPIKVMTYNLCGNICFEANEVDGTYPSVDTRGEVASRASRVVASVDNHNSDIVFLNETCYSQYRAIREALVQRGYQSTYASTTTGGKCDDYDTTNGRGFGNAVFSKGPVPNVQQKYDLGGSHLSEDGVVRTYQMLCTDTSVQGVPTKACATHLISGDESVRASQMAQVTELVNNFQTNQPTILAGDLNVIPTDPTLDGLYRFQNGTIGKGLFQEGDQTDPNYEPFGAVNSERRGESTFNESSKLDYLFFSHRHFKFITADARSRFPDPISDHRVYQSEAYWQAF